MEGEEWGRKTNTFPSVLFIRLINIGDSFYSENFQKNCILKRALAPSRPKMGSKSCLTYLFLLTVS